MNKIYFYKEIKGKNYEVAHVYEHIFLNAFRKYAKENGFAEGIYGWASSDVYYDSVILLDGGFYDSRAEKLFWDFLARGVGFSDEEIRNGTATVSAEYLSDIEITDWKAFRTGIEEIAKIPFLSLDDSLTMKQYEIKKWKDDPKIAKVTDNKKGFRKIRINFNYTSKSLEDVAIVFRLWPVLGDNIHAIVYDMGGYGSDTLSPGFSKENDYLDMGITANFRKEKDLKKRLKIEIEKMRSRIAFSKLEKELKIYADGYKNSLNFAHTQEDIMDDAGILVSRNKIAELFTPENVQRVWDSFELEIK